MAVWLTWALAALVSWGLWAVMSKLLGGTLSAEQSQALSTFGFVSILVPLAWRCRRRLGGASRRGWVLALVAIWLFNVSEDSTLISPRVLVALLPIALWGGSGFLQKAATNHVSGEVAALVYLAAFVPMGIFYGVTEPAPGPIGMPAWIAVIALGFFLAFGNFAVLAAYARHGKAAVIAPLVNRYPLVSLTVAVPMGERVDGREALGIVCAVAAAAALSVEAVTTRSPT